MKKFYTLLPLMLLFIYVQGAFATVMNDTIPQAFEISLDIKDTLGTGSNWTNVNGVDSATLKSNWSPKSGWAYFLYYKPLSKVSVEGTADTIHVTLRLIAKDYNKSVLNYMTVDSLRGNGSSIALPVGSPMVGFYYDLKIYITCANATDSAKVNFMAIGKRRSP